MLNKKGQSSIEIIIIAMAIFVLVAVLVSEFSPLKASTIAIATAKTNTLMALNSGSENFIIERIGFEESSENASFFIATIPNSISCEDANGSGTKELIISQGLYENPKVFVNSEECFVS